MSSLLKLYVNEVIDVLAHFIFSLQNQNQQCVPSKDIQLHSKVIISKIKLNDHSSLYNAFPQTLVP